MDDTRDQVCFLVGEMFASKLGFLAWNKDGTWKNLKGSWKNLKWICVWGVCAVNKEEGGEIMGWWMGVKVLVVFMVWCEGYLPLSIKYLVDLMS
jgi:hypothetical protein